MVSERAAERLADLAIKMADQNICQAEHRQPKLTFRAVGRYKLVLRNTRPLRIL